MTNSPYSKEIYYQGFFDGACFLYSVTNCFRALTGEGITQGKWNKAIKVIPFVQDFMHTNGGTGRFDYALVEDTTQKILEIYSAKKQFSFNVERIIGTKISKIVESIDANTIVLFAINSERYNLNHWLCAVSFTAQPVTIRLACSSPHIAVYNKDNSVRSDDQFKGRHYNWELSNFKDFNIQNKFCYAISIM